MVIGAVLAELLSIWLANHQLIADVPDEQERLWEKLLQHHIKWVRQLTKENAQLLRLQWGKDET
jgi:hypothetical protein